jgi:hypothetical protein
MGPGISSTTLWNQHNLFRNFAKIVKIAVFQVSAIQDSAYFQDQGTTTDARLHTAKEEKYCNTNCKVYIRVKC